MSEPTILELIAAAAALIVFVVVAWKASVWLSQLGCDVRPVSLMDRHMTRIEQQFAERQAKQRARGGSDDGPAQG